MPITTLSCHSDLETVQKLHNFLASD